MHVMHDIAAGCQLLDANPDNEVASRIKWALSSLCKLWLVFTIEYTPANQHNLAQAVQFSSETVQFRDW